MFIIKTGTTYSEAQELINLGLDASTADIKTRIVEVGGKENIYVAWSLAKLISFLPCDENHKWSIETTTEGRLKIKLFSKTDGYRRSFERDNPVDVVVLALKFLLSKKIIK